jgi:hypothetical protein
MVTELMKAVQCRDHYFLLYQHDVPVQEGIKRCSIARDDILGVGDARAQGREEIVRQF